MTRTAHKPADPGNLTAAQRAYLAEIHAAGTSGHNPANDSRRSGAHTALVARLLNAGLIVEHVELYDYTRPNGQVVKNERRTIRLTVDGLIAMHRAGLI